MSAIVGPRVWPHAATLRSIAVSIEPAFPDAADMLRGIARTAPAPDPAGDTGLRTRIEAALDDSIRFDRVEWVRAGDVRAALDGTEERS